jgi:hypothetical protein
MTSRRYIFNLDINVNEDLINLIEEIANGGPTSKALIKILYQWQMLRYGNITATKEIQNDSIPIRNIPNENFDLVKEFNNIFD